MDFTSQRNTSIIIFALLQSYGTVGVNGTACDGFAAELVVHAVNGQSCQRIARGFSSCAFDFRAGVYLEGTLIIGKLNLDIFACLANASNSNCTVNIQPPKSCKANGTATASLGNLYFFNGVFMKRY